MCLKITQDGDLQLGAYVADYEGYSAALYTHKDFGCVLFENTTD